MTKKILTDLDATGRTITAGIFSGVANNDTINTITGATSTASFWSDVTTGTIGIGTGVTTGTISIGTGLTTGRVDIAVGSGSTPTSTVNINTGKSGSQSVTTNIGSSTSSGGINLYTGAPGVILNGTALIRTPTAITSGTSIGLSITTGQGALGASSGSVTIDAGQIPTGAGTAGTVLIGNNYATSLTIGRSNITTTINGTLATTSPSITTSLTTPSTSFDLLNTTATTINAFGFASTISIGSAATSLTLGQGSSNLTANKSVNIAGSTGSNALATGVTSTLNLNNYYAIAGTSTTSLGGGYSLTGTATLNIGTFSGSVSGTNNITIGSSPGTTTINGTLVASAPAGSLTGTSLPSAITSATGLGITSGGWTGTAIAASKGGTGQTSFTQYGVAYGASSTALAETAAGTAGQVLTATSTAPAWASPLAVPRPTGDYYTSTSYTTATGSGGTSTTLLSYIPVYLPAIQTITSLGVWISSIGNASNVLGFGLYSNSTSNKPETKLLDGGTVTSLSNSSVNSVSGLSYTLPSAGWYWVALQLVSTPTTASTYALATSTNIPGSSSSFIMPNATSPTTMNTHYTQTITAAQTLPTTAGTLNTSTAGAPKVYVGI